LWRGTPEGTFIPAVFEFDGITVRNVQIRNFVGYSVRSRAHSSRRPPLGVKTWLVKSFRTIISVIAEEGGKIGPDHSKEKCLVRREARESGSRPVLLRAKQGAK